MSERNDLLASIAATIAPYRAGSITRPTPAHVDRWVSQFTPVNQLPFLREFNHVIGKTFLKWELVQGFLDNLIGNPKLAGTDPKNYWARANVLQIQKAGGSQREMVKQFGVALKSKLGLDLAACGAADGDYIYLDDVLFTGSRIQADLADWIANTAPAQATVHVILMAYHMLGEFYTKKNLNAAIAKSGKKIKVTFWRLVECENRKIHKNSSDVLWPAVVPADAAVQAYVPSVKFPLEPRAPGGTYKFFSSEAGRQILETEFLIAGVKIRGLSGGLSDWYRPLGCGNFGVGFGSLIVTYRNCPNNCPLALWWGDPQAGGALDWYPLLPRETNAARAIRDAFSVITD